MGHQVISCRQACEVIRIPGYVCVWKVSSGTWANYHCEHKSLKSTGILPCHGSFLLKDIVVVVFSASRITSGALGGLHAVLLVG